MQQIFGEVGLMVGEDPRQIRHVIGIIQQCGQILLIGGQSEELSHSCTLLTNYISSYITGEGDQSDNWVFAENLIATIERIIANLEYGLEKKQLVVFLLGRFIGNWNKDEVNDVSLSDSNEQSLRHLLSGAALVPDQFTRAIRLLEDYRKEESVFMAMNYPHKIYNTIRRSILNEISGINTG